MKKREITTVDKGATENMKAVGAHIHQHLRKIVPSDITWMFIGILNAHEVMEDGVTPEIIGYGNGDEMACLFAMLEVMASMKENS